ncbi:hypothetical protein C7S13_8697 [Burkholderia cepacia]|nr:hypothetical protein [Burkholderia cepacia]
MSVSGKSISAANRFKPSDSAIDIPSDGKSFKPAAPHPEQAFERAHDMRSRNRWLACGRVVTRVAKFSLLFFQRPSTP